MDLELSDPKLAKDPGKLAELSRRRDKTQAALDKAEALWIAAAEAYEAARGAA